MERRLRILIKIDIGRLPVEKAALAEIIPESAQITELFQLKKKPKLLPRFPEDRFFLRLPRIDVPADGNIEKVGKVFFTVGPLLIPNPGLPVFPGHDPKVYHPVKEPFPVGAFPGDRAFFLQILRQFHQHFHSTAAFPVIWFYCTAKFSFPQWTRREIYIKRDLFNIKVSFSFNPYNLPA